MTMKSFMERYRNRGRKDNNHKTLSDVLLWHKCDVVDLSAAGDGVMDLFVFVSTLGRWFEVEIKNPSTRYGRRGLNLNQKKKVEQRRFAPVYILETVADAENLAAGRIDMVKIVYPEGVKAA